MTAVVALALDLLKRFWPYLIGAAVVIGLVLRISSLNRQLHDCQAHSAAIQASFDQTVANVRAATAQAQAEDHAHAVDVETKQAAISKESNDALTKQLADARAAAVAYAARLRSQASSADGNSNNARVSQTAQPASGTADANRTSLLAEDIRICGDNTVKVEAWRSWWDKARAVQ